MTRARIFCESNLTPVFGPSSYFDAALPIGPTNLRWVQNQAHRDYMVNLGYDEFTMIYNGTLNRLETWWGRAAADVANGQVAWQDAAGASNERNYANPLDADAVMRLSSLHRTNLYGGSKRLLMPICFDIESSPLVNLSIDDAPDVMAGKVAGIEKAIMAARDPRGGGADTDCWWYEFPGTPGLAPSSAENVAAIDRFYRAQQPLADVVTDACCSFYNWDVPAVSPGSWYDMPQGMDGVIAKYYSRLRSKVAFVCPVYQIYWPQNDPAGVGDKNGKPVDYATWMRQIDYLIENGWDIVVWMGAARHEPVIMHLQYVARFRR